MRITVFVCDRERPTCYRCPMAASVQCATCKRRLCDTHRRKKDGEDRCSQHAPMEVSAMPAPPPLRRPSVPESPSMETDPPPVVSADAAKAIEYVAPRICQAEDEKDNKPASARVCTAAYYGKRCEREVDARGVHHGSHSADNGTVRWGDTFSRDCDGPCKECEARQREYLEMVAQTGRPALYSRPWTRLKSGSWTADDVKSWAREQLAKMEASHAEA